ncbi:MAG TPA: enoyl-CoA hydratase/isomerase family protein, partial [Bacillota bacterium]|nr:enoyl-CoA hydratase/isomerase family protein [Bacillota bacterium]
MPTYEHLLYEKHGGVALLTMNRPEIMNALEAALARDLVSALREAAADDEIGSIVLTGTGKSFSSGGDL